MILTCLIMSCPEVYHGLAAAISKFATPAWMKLMKPFSVTKNFTFLLLILSDLAAPSGTGPVSPCYPRIGNVAHETQTETRRAAGSPAESLGRGGVGSACPRVPGR